MKTNYNRPALHRKYIEEGKMTEEESDREIRDWKIKFEVDENVVSKMVNDMSVGIIEMTADWKDVHGYQNDEGEWEV